MKFQTKTIGHAIAGKARRSLATALLSTAAFITVISSVEQAQAQVLEEIVVTAQRRETNLQSTPIAITAYSGDVLANNKVFTVTDLANAVPAFSLTANTPLDVELNIRGITNTRLDAPSADASVGTFLDGVFIGRTGDLNFDFYDLERIEVIRGPQGVLLGKNVVGGALSIITAKPSFESSGKVLVSYGNYNAKLVSGYVTGGATDTVATRFSFQYRNHDGYAQDILHNREVENLDAVQMRGQVLITPEGGDFTARLIVDYNRDSNNGLNVIAVQGGTPSCETSYLRTNCTRPWSNLRRFLGLTNPRINMAQSVQYFGDPNPTQQFFEREGAGFTADLEREFESFSFNSLTNYRKGYANQNYDQTGLGPEALNWNTTQWLTYVGFVATTRPGGVTAPAVSNNGQFLFAEPVAEKTNVKAFSQEFRLTSTNEDSNFDWIAGVYFKQDHIDKTDHFIGENFVGGLFVSPTPTLANGGPLSTLSGEDLWVNNGRNKTYAGFAQVGFKFNEMAKLTVGARYTEDKKKGNVSGFAIRTGDRFNPRDVPALTPLRANYAQGTGFNTAYGKSWNKFTPQATFDFTPSDELYLYATVARGFKGGGFDDTPSSDIAARIPFNPETVTNYEGGFKANLLDRRLRFNASVFYMDYKDLQVTQTNAACLCNLTDNAASASIKGVEGESEFLVGEGVRLSASGSYVTPKYKNFLESAINPTTGQRLNSSGNRLQRTPKTQLSGSIDFTAGTGAWQDAVNFRVEYTWQSNMFWATDNIAREPSYGLWDARIGLSPPDANWSLAAYGKNLSNKLYRVNIIPFFGEEVTQYAAPRTYGMDLTLKF